MPGNKLWSTKVCKIAVWFCYIFSIFFWHTIRFPRFNPSSASKIFNVFLAIINTKYFSNIPEEKYVAPLRVLNLSIKSFANPFVDLALIFCDRSFNSFLFVVTSFCLLSKSVFFTKLLISLLLARFARFNRKLKISAVNVLNSGVVICLSWLLSGVFFQFH